jgi:hypothetical protein
MKNFGAIPRVITHMAGAGAGIYGAQACLTATLTAGMATPLILLAVAAVLACGYFTVISTMKAVEATLGHGEERGEKRLQELQEEGARLPDEKIAPVFNPATKKAVRVMKPLKINKINAKAAPRV